MPEGDEKANQLELPVAGPGSAPAAPSLVGNRVKYLDKLAAYESRFETNLRNLKRWIAEGKKVNPPDLPPLDSPSQMAAWWGRRMRQRVPAKLLALAGPALSCSAATAEVVTSEESGWGGVIKEVGDSVVQRLRSAEESAHRLWIDAIKSNSPDAGLIELRERSWARITEQLRRAEKDAIASAGVLGESIPRTELTRELQPLFASLSTGFRQFLRRVRPKLTGLSEADQDAVYELELNSLFKLIHENELVFPAG